MRKVRIDVTVCPQAADFVAGQCKKYDRRLSYVVEKALLFARDNGLDLGAVQAQGLEKWMREHEKAEA